MLKSSLSSFSSLCIWVISPKLPIFAQLSINTFSLCHFGLFISLFRLLCQVKLTLNAFVFFLLNFLQSVVWQSDSQTKLWEEKIKCSLLYRAPKGKRLCSLLPLWYLQCREWCSAQQVEEAQRATEHVHSRPAGGDPGEPAIDLILTRYLGKVREECTADNELHLKAQVHTWSLRTEFINTKTGQKGKCTGYRQLGQPHKASEELLFYKQLETMGRLPVDEWDGQICLFKHSF